MRMTNKKVEKFCNDQFSTIFNETTVKRAYDLGFARVFFELYNHIAEGENIEYADKIFRFVKDAECWELFNKLVELYKEENRKEKISKIQQFYNSALDTITFSCKNCFLKIDPEWPSEYKNYCPKCGYKLDWN